MSSKDSLYSNTEKLFDIANLTELIELDKLFFKLLEIVLVVRVIQDDDIVYIKEEDYPIIHLKA